MLQVAETLDCRRHHDSEPGELISFLKIAENAYKAEICQVWNADFLTKPCWRQGPRGSESLGSPRLTHQEGQVWSRCERRIDSIMQGFEVKQSLS